MAQTEAIKKPRLPEVMHQLKNFKPQTPAMMKAKLMMRLMSLDSLKNMMLITTAAAVPIPVNTV